MQPLDYQPPEESGVPSLPLAIIACAIGLLGNALGMLAASMLRHEPIGASIRPMGLELRMFMIVLATAGIGGISGIIAFAGNRKRKGVWAVAAIGTILSLMPWFTAMAVWNHIIAQRGLIMEP